MLSIIFSERRRKMVEEAGDARRSANRRIVALVAVISYNIVGILDIISTNGAIGAGLGEEANPFPAYLMTTLGSDWIWPKLALQAVITAMVLWFPHRLVLGMFISVVAANALIVANNFHIYLG